jgi:hypothetical protein
MATLLRYAILPLRIVSLFAIVSGLAPTAGATCYGRNGGYDYIVWCGSNGCYGAARKVGTGRYMDPVPLTKDEAASACADLL